jgi:hypothetical protein
MTYTKAAQSVVKSAQSFLLAKEAELVKAGHSQADAERIAWKAYWAAQKGGV